MALARIGIGSNVGDAAASVLRACDRLTRFGNVLARSSLYASKAWGVTDQPDFVNAAVLLDTALEPYPLLHELKSLEVELGRVATYRWGPRAIDLDILAYDDLVLDAPELTIPHPRTCLRARAARRDRRGLLAVARKPRCRLTPRRRTDQVGVYNAT